MQLQIFKYQSEEEQMFNEITTLEINGEIWFLANDVCKALDIVNVSDAVSRLDEDEKLTSVLPIAGQNRTVSIISESVLLFRNTGVYHLIEKFDGLSQQKLQKKKYIY